MTRSERHEGQARPLPGLDHPAALAWLGVVMLGLCGLGCGSGQADAVGTKPASSRPKPASGPWFVDRARDYGLDIVTPCGSPGKESIHDSLGSGVALFDFDNDDDLDIFVTACSKVVDGVVRQAAGPWLFRNEGPGRWVDKTRDAGLTYTGWSQAVAVADYDADGDLDVFVAQQGPDVLWQNQGDGRFIDVSKHAGICDAYWGVGTTWGDADGDGWPDLYVTNYLQADPLHPAPPLEYLPGVHVFRGPTALPGQPDILWRNKGDGTFEDGTSSAGLDKPDGKGMAALFADFDNDGNADLYVTNDTQPNHFFRGLGGGKFREEGLEAGVAVNGMGVAEGSMGIDAADFDGDGRLDLLHANFRHEGSRLHQNLGNGSFKDVSSGSYVNVNTLRFVGWSVILADFDDDGHPDIFQANGHVYPKVPDSDYAQPPVFLRNKGGGRFEPATSAWGPQLASACGGRSAAAGDLDGDGDLDLVVTTMDGPLRVLINEGNRTRHSAEIRLVGPRPNVEALGARVELQAGGRTLHAQVKRGGNFLAAPDAALHFGLKDATHIDKVIVHWPGGKTSSFEGLPADSRITLRQDDGGASVIPFRPAPTSLLTNLDRKP
ncbi:CRTAC1 family protein [Singulisphaera sp. PoT]|uniref:CRTAC1 family protein n=1 Tax=Singulisphaera sp. PoT TaxID=3411797 RepID=UPI003BF589BB